MSTDTVQNSATDANLTLAQRTQRQKETRDKMAAEDKKALAEYSPIKIKPDVTYKILVGKRATQPTEDEAGFVHKVPLQDRTILVRHHDTVIDIFCRLSIPTDGSMVMLRPGTSLPFCMEDMPYDSLQPLDTLHPDDPTPQSRVGTGGVIHGGVTLSVVPNTNDEVGPDARVSASRPMVPLTHDPDEPKGPFKAKLLRDTHSNRPDILVNSVVEENKARADGYDVEIPAPPAL